MSVIINERHAYWSCTDIKHNGVNLIGVLYSNEGGARLNVLWMQSVCSGFYFVPLIRCKTHCLQLNWSGNLHLSCSCGVISLVNLNEMLAGSYGLALDGEVWNSKDRGI